MSSKVHEKKDVLQNPYCQCSVGVGGETSDGNKGCKVNASGPEGFAFGGYDAFSVGFARGGGEGWFEVSVAIFPGLGNVSGEF